MSGGESVWRIKKISGIRNIFNEVPIGKIYERKYPKCTFICQIEVWEINLEYKYEFGSTLHVSVMITDTIILERYEGYRE